LIRLQKREIKAKTTICFFVLVSYSYSNLQIVVDASNLPNFVTC
jgi:hypothetical protein